MIRTTRDQRQSAPEQVECNDVQDALASALAAFDLPEWFLDVRR